MFLKIYQMRISSILFFLLFVGLCAHAQTGNTIKLTNLFPESIGAGTNFTVDLSFDKPEIQAYAVFKQTFPKGFIVKEAQSESAEFSFEKNELNLTWLRLPQEKHFTVSYTIQVDSAVSGIFAMNGKLTYFVDNRQGTVILPSDTLTVKKAGNPTLYKDIAEKVDTAKKENNPVLVSANEHPKKDISCLRELPVSIPEKNEFEVKLKISKGDLVSTARITEIIPPDFEARESDSQGAVFSFVDNKATFIWNKLPETPEITVKYTLIPKDKNNKTQPELNGQMLYISDGKVVPLIVKRNY